MSRAKRPRYLDGAALRRERSAAGLEQAQLADRVNAKAAQRQGATVTQAQISDWEHGRYGCRIGTLHQLADALGIDPARLLLRAEGQDADGEDAPEPKGAAA